jgi:hypothetical protein
MRPLLFCFLLAAAAIACASTRATSTFNAWQARYAVPPDDPHGQVTIAAVGMTPPSDPQGGGLLHLRMAVDNQSPDELWSVNPSAQELQLAGAAGERLRPTGASNRPLAIAPGQRRSIDLYYSLPASLRDERRLGGFDLEWRLTSPRGTYTERTVFARTSVASSGQAVELPGAPGTTVTPGIPNTVPSPVPPSLPPPDAPSTP